MLFILGVLIVLRFALDRGTTRKCAVLLLNHLVQKVETLQITVDLIVVRRLIHVDGHPVGFILLVGAALTLVFFGFAFQTSTIF